MNKKIISITLSGLMLSPLVQLGGVVNSAVVPKTKLAASTVITATSNQNNITQSSILTKDQIEKLIREKLGLDSTYKLTNSDLSVQDLNKKQIWNLTFNSDSGNTNISAYAENGEIINLNNWTNNDNNSTMTILSETAKKAATDFIQKLEPDKFKDVVEFKSVKSPSIIYYKIISIDGNDYNFMFVRSLNGELMPNNYFNVRVSGVTGKVTSYELNWNDASNNNEKVMSESDARKIFEAKNNLTLKYVQFYDEQNKEAANLTPVYVYNTDAPDKINAVTGELISEDNLYSWSYHHGPYYGMDINAQNEKSLAATGTALTELVPEEGALSKEKAEKLILDTITNEIDTKDIKAQNASYIGEYNGVKGKYWSIYFTNSDNSISLSGIVDASKNKVISISFGQNSDIAISKSDDKTKIDEGSVTQLLKSKITKMFPSLIDGKDYKLTVQKNDNGTYSIKSSRYINEIPFDQNNIEFIYNPSSKKVTGFNYVWYDVNAKFSDKILKNSDAVKIFFDKVGIEKYLVQLKDQESYKKDKLNIPIKNAVPVYSPKTFDFSYIDAVSGKFLGYDGKEYSPSLTAKYELKDIDNSTYKNEILLMNQMGKLELGSETFSPSDKLLKKDAIKWISLLNVNKLYDPLAEKTNPKSDVKDIFKDLNENDPYYTYINNAWKAGIFEKDGDNFNENSVVTKEDITKWIINALGMKRYALYTKMFEISYTDSANLKADFKGYAALADYYNLFGNKGESTSFDSARTFNRDEFVSILYHYMLNNL